MARDIKLEISLLSELDARRKVIELINDAERIDVAVAWAGKNSVVRALVEHHKKLRHVVIGTHMFQTDPEVLRWLMPHDVGCMPPDGRLFHPKVYLFGFGESIAALVGSHNMTSSAFDGKNVEASVLIQGAKGEAVFRDLAEFIQAAWNSSEGIDENFLFPYEKQYAINREKRRELERFHRVKRPRPGAGSPSPMDLTWEDYLEGLERDEIGSPRVRLEILETARSLFEQKTSLLNMERNERRAIAGTYGSKEEGLHGLPWAAFGTMFGAGDFKNLVNESPGGLSAALDHIPLEGDVNESIYRKFASQFVSAFEGKSRKGGVATASRLLAMKRPDIFVAVNNANNRGLANALGVSPASINIETYWGKVIVPTQLSPWWYQARPVDGIQRRIWDNRAALIDAHYYVAP